MNRILFLPRTGEEVLRAAPDGTKLFLYSEIANLTPLQLLKRFGKDNIILYQNPRKMNSGHWSAVKILPEIQEAYFFSSYGGKPDEEKNKWIQPTELQKSRQNGNSINDLLKFLYRIGWTVYYNDYHYQELSDGTATCGIWASAFLNSEENPDDFERDHKDLHFYYNRFFR